MSINYHFSTSVSDCNARSFLRVQYCTLRKRSPLGARRAATPSNAPRMMLARCALAVAATLSTLGHRNVDAAAVPSFPPHLVGNVSAVHALLERVLPGSSAHFDLAIDRDHRCPGVPSGKACFTLADGAGGKTTITGTTASELTGGLGVYLREYCGMTIGWVRGGGSYLFTPTVWPAVGSPVSRARSVPYSHVTQVCTHSYTLVWHDWLEWEAFIDWMALAGHNSIVAPTGQEEVQYRVLTEHFGVSDMAVRNWTNGPAWLTWSRGQNSHGNGIGGPLPRSFMRGQWSLQRQILARYRELGIAGHLPSFGGWAPWELAVVQNATKAKTVAQGKGTAADTAWIDGRDPLYTAVADRWMAEVTKDFGSDHVWQMDGFFADGSGWGAASDAHSSAAAQTVEADIAPSLSVVPCEWSAIKKNTYLAGYVHGHSVSFHTLEEAKAACIDPANLPNCGGEKLAFLLFVFGLSQACLGEFDPFFHEKLKGPPAGVVSRANGGSFEIRAGTTPKAVPASDREASYLVLNRKQCNPVRKPAFLDPFGSENDHFAKTGSGQTWTS